LCVYPDIWAAGISESGISDMQVLLEETHKFESRYLGPLCFDPSSSLDDQKAEIRKRSPIYSAERIKAPPLILSGEVDNIVRPNQAKPMAEEIRAEGGVVDIRVYEGEGHMFQKGSSLKDMEVLREAWFKTHLAGK